MTDTFNLFTALQWADTAFPSGRYTLSHGLEGLVAEGIVVKRDLETLQIVAEEMVRYSLAPVDLAAHYCAWNAGTVKELLEVDAAVTAARPTQSQRKGSVRVGKQMLIMAENLGVSDPLLGEYHAEVKAKRADGNQSVAAALVHRGLGQTVRSAAIVEAFGYIASLSSAAIRLQVTDYVGAQQLTSRLQPVVEEAIAIAERTPVEHIGACTPLVDIASARHETAAARLFIT